jgi:hypothetical protein
MDPKIGAETIVEERYYYAQDRYLDLIQSGSGSFDSVEFLKVRCEYLKARCKYWEEAVESWRQKAMGNSYFEPEPKKKRRRRLVPSHLMVLEGGLH